MKLHPIILYSFCLFMGISIRSYSQNDPFTSHLYFPAAIGINLPFGNSESNLSRGIMITTALEYRPKEGDHVFYRFTYDAIGNNYSNVLIPTPTNVNSGHFSESFFSLGSGYRKVLGPIRVFGLIQPGIATNSYEKVIIDESAIGVGHVKEQYFGVKASLGAEYYLAEHFALTFEPSYFYLAEGKSFRLPNPQSVNFSVGFTMTLF